MVLLRLKVLPRVKCWRQQYLVHLLPLLSQPQYIGIFWQMSYISKNMVRAEDLGVDALPGYERERYPAPVPKSTIAEWRQSVGSANCARRIGHRV